MTPMAKKETVSEKKKRRFGSVFPKFSDLHVHRESFPFILKRSAVVSVVILVLGCGLSLISTATTYVSQVIAGIIR